MRSRIATAEEWTTRHACARTTALRMPSGVDVIPKEALYATAFCEIPPTTAATSIVDGLRRAIVRFTSANLWVSRKIRENRTLLDKSGVKSTLYL